MIRYVRKWSVSKQGRCLSRSLPIVDCLVNSCETNSVVIFAGNYFDGVHGKGDGIVEIDGVYGKDHDGVQKGQNDNLSPRIAIDFGAGAKAQSGALT